MAIVFARLQERVNSYVEPDVCQLIKSCSLCAERTKNTATATSCRFLPYAVGLRGNFAGRTRHDICSITRAIKYKNMEVFPEVLITTAKGLRYPQRGMPHHLPTSALRGMQKSVRYQCGAPLNRQMALPEHHMALSGRWNVLSGR